MALVGAMGHRNHRPSAASITALAMGPATVPPVAADVPSKPSTITATATVEASPGGPAKAIIQPWDFGGVVPSCAVPVFAPTSMPGIAIVFAVPFWTTPIRSRRRVDALPEVIESFHGL